MSKDKSIVLADSCKSHIFGDYIDESVCDKLIEYFENPNIEKYKGMVGAKTGEGMVDARFKESMECDLPYYGEFATQDTKSYFNALSTMMKKYNSLFPEISRVMPFDILEMTKIQKYSPPGGGYHAMHIENDGGKTNLSRYLVFMTYLNDVTDGGETVFPFQNFICKPRKGLTLIWPAHFNYPHKGIPSFTQTKYIATGWFNFVDAHHKLYS